MDDKEYFTSRAGVKPDEAQLEAFSERVSIKNIDGGISLDDAREQAFVELNGQQ
jgi:hypothetical protein